MTGLWWWPDGLTEPDIDVLLWLVAVELESDRPAGSTAVLPASRAAPESAAYEMADYTIR